MKTLLRTRHNVNSFLKLVGVSSPCCHRNASTDGARARPFQELPVHGYPLIGDIVGFFKNIEALPEYFSDLHRKYGPIFRMTTGRYDFVHIADPDCVEKVLRAEAKKHPTRIDLPIMIDVRKEIGAEEGIFTLKDEEWYTSRRKLNKSLMQTTVMNMTTPLVSKTTASFLDFLRNINDQQGYIDLHQEAVKYSMEVLSMSLYGRQMGCMDTMENAEATRWMEAVRIVSELTIQLVHFPPTIRKYIFRKSWTKYVDAWRTIFQITHKYVTDTMTRTKNEEEFTCLLHHMITSSEWRDLDEICGNVADLMFAGIDTSSGTIQVAAHVLSERPDIQQKIHDEVTNVLGTSDTVDAGHLQKMPYVRGAVKELLRLYPAAIALSRVLQSDIVLHDFIIPKGKVIIIPLYTIGRQEKIFSRCDEFLPERWIRGTDSEKHHPFAFLPFGFGTRTCVGRRLAETELTTFLALLYKRYKTELTDNIPLKMKTGIVWTPVSPVRLRLTEW